MKKLTKEAMNTATLLFVVGLLVLSVPAVVGAQDSVNSISVQVPDNLQVPQSVVDSIANEKKELYAILMVDLPLSSYDGDLSASDYENRLESSHRNLLASVGGGELVYDYTYAANGFAAKMTASQAEALKGHADVSLVSKNEIRHVQTDNTPDYLGLTDRGGVYDWGYDGEGVVVGVVDTGIWPEHPSFADDGSYDAPPESFTGTGCDFGNTDFNPDDAPFECNNKLIAAKAYGDGFHGGTGEGLADGSYNSARDENGHGSHTASTAAGNADVDASIQGSDLGTVQGIAPRAHISVYKACWSTSPIDGGCSSVDLVEAIDQAVADGVDVINYSIGGSSTQILTPDALSFLFAADAGVFVASSNGNAGPGAATTGNPASSPWLTSVGASTHDRDFRGTATTGDGVSYTGVTLTGGSDELPLVDAEDYGNELCDPDVAFTGDVSGKIVLCQRGAFARVAKSQAVANAGGAGMILYNPALNTLNTDNHYVPSLHVDHVDGPAIKDYIDTAGEAATASLSGGFKVDSQGGVMAAFSSRGPNPASDIIKPDVTAPGVNVLAANTPTALLGSPGELFQSISGTSMSSPHVAGLFALSKQANPDWTPAMAKSALMTTAQQDVLKEDGETPADPFDMGSGEVVVDYGTRHHWRWWDSDVANMELDGGGHGSHHGHPRNLRGTFLNPGLVYDAGFLDYLGFLCDAEPSALAPGTCGYLASIGIATDASDLNYPSIAVAELVGSQTVTRTVTSVTDYEGWRVYKVHVDEPEGFDVDVSPKIMWLKPGMSATYELTITNEDAETGQWEFGSVTLRDFTGQYSVRSPLAVRAFQVDAPNEVSYSGTDGTESFDVKFGYDGDYTAAAHGLVPADVQAGYVVDDPANDINTALGTGVGITVHGVVLSDAAYARFSLFDDFTDGNDDLDLYVFNPDGAFIAGSGSGTSEEEVNVANPVDGVWLVVVHGWQTDGPDANYDLFSWGIPNEADTGSLSVSGPSTAVTNTMGTVTVSWSGLSTGTKYLGAVSHSDSAGVLALTIVGVDT